jgi:hypothetical protein
VARGAAWDQIRRLCVEAGLATAAREGRGLLVGGFTVVVNVDVPSIIHKSPIVCAEPQFEMGVLIGGKAVG